MFVVRGSGVFLSDARLKSLALLLRPLTELHVTKLFCEHPLYFEKFTSCNKNWRIAGDRPTERWCRTCPKCAFVFCLMAAFLDRKTLERMFGGNLFEDQALTTLYRQLLGLEGMKPFECVGTPEETKAAFLLAHRRGELDDTPMMRMFIDDVLPSIKGDEALIAKELTVGKRHVIPEQFAQLLPS